jgi:hypothetical protein
MLDFQFWILDEDKSAAMKLRASSPIQNLSLLLFANLKSKIHHSKPLQSSALSTTS